MQIMRRYWREITGIITLAGMLILVAFTVPAQARPIPMQPADPPECIKVSIQENSGNGPVLYADFCGFGSEGLSPLASWVASHGPLVVDGGPISPSACTLAQRCYIIGINSPQTGP